MAVGMIGTGHALTPRVFSGAGRRKITLPKYWIKGAIKRPGALRAKAARAGAMIKSGGRKVIKSAFLAMKARGKGRTGRQARLAQTLKKLG